MKKYLPGRTDKLEQPCWGVNLPHSASEDAQGKCSKNITHVQLRTLKEGRCPICIGKTIAGHVWAVLGAVDAIFSSQQIAQQISRNMLKKVNMDCGKSLWASVQLLWSFMVKEPGEKTLFFPSEVNSCSLLEVTKKRAVKRRVSKT